MGGGDTERMGPSSNGLQPLHAAKSEGVTNNIVDARKRLAINGKHETMALEMKSKSSHMAFSAIGAVAFLFFIGASCYSLFYGQFWFAFCRALGALICGLLAMAWAKPDAE